MSASSCIFKMKDCNPKSCHLFWKYLATFPFAFHLQSSLDVTQIWQHQTRNRNLQTLVIQMITQTTDNVNTGSRHQNKETELSSVLIASKLSSVVIACISMMVRSFTCLENITGIQIVSFLFSQLPAEQFLRSVYWNVHRKLWIQKASQQTQTEVQ